MKRIALFTLLIALASSVFAIDESRFAAAIVMEPTTGRVLYEKNSHAPLPTASMVKMMTLLVTMENIKAGTLSLDTPVIISAKASKMGGSQVYLKQGERFTVRDLLAATMIHSANDAAMALAEQVGGTEGSFVNLMNRRAQALGLKESHFYDPHGLPASKGEQLDVMSAYDLARLGVELMKYPLMRQYAVIPQAPFRGGVFTMYNPNRLLGTFPGATGIKTGYSVPAGFCVTASAKRGDMELICVVMGGKTKADCFDSAAELMSEAFAMWRRMPVTRKGAPVNGRIPVSGGAESSVPVMAGGDSSVLVQQGDEGKISLGFTGTAKAPVKRGQTVGTIVVKQNGKPVQKVPALAAADVAKQPWWKAWIPW